MEAVAKTYAGILKKKDIKASISTIACNTNNAIVMLFVAYAKNNTAYRDLLLPTFMEDHNLSEYITQNLLIDSEKKSNHQVL